MIDVNGTRYHLLLGERDWKPLLAKSPTSPSSDNTSQQDKLEWHDDYNAVILEQKSFKFPKVTNDQPLEPSQSRRGVDSDIYGNWYWISSSEKEIYITPANSNKKLQFWPTDSPPDNLETNKGNFQNLEILPKPQPQNFSGLAITEDNFLVVGTREPAGILVFDLHAGGSPQQFLWPKDVAFSPFDMTARAKGGLWILDRENKLLWELDRQFQPCSQRASITSPIDDESERSLATFQPKMAGEARYLMLEPAFEGTDLSSNISDPVAIERFGNDVFILNSDNKNSKIIQIYNCSSREVLPTSIDIGNDPPEDDKAFINNLTGYDISFIAEEKQLDSQELLLGQLYLVTKEGNQAYEFELIKDNEDIKLKIKKEIFYPMRRFNGKGLVINKQTRKPYYSFDDLWVPLVKKDQPRYKETGELRTSNKEEDGVFDGREFNCVWHRLMLDGCFPPETGVRVLSRASNNIEDLQNDVLAWQPEPTPYKRSTGSELPYTSKSSKQDEGTWELLFQQAQGRYLQLKIDLYGNGRSTPRLCALRAYYPRFSYLKHYLPKVYQKDERSASFLERFLANVEGVFTNIEDKIAAVQILFDPQTTPVEALEWLAAWWGVALDPAWDEARRRLFIKNAYKFFQYRGTAYGLMMLLRLALEPCASEDIFTDPLSSKKPIASARIVEKYQVKAENQPISNADSEANNASTENQPTSNTDSEDNDVSKAHQFTVFLPLDLGEEGNSAVQQEKLELIKRIVEVEKPAHTTFDIKFFWAMFRVGEARLGQDTVIELGGRTPALSPPMVLGQEYLSEAHLTPRHPQNISGRQVIGQIQINNC